MATPAARTRTAARLAACLAVVACTVAAVPVSPPTTGRVDGGIPSWVDQLNAPDPAGRAAAEHRLSAAGRRAIPALSAALDDPRAEVAIRARWVLRRIQLFALHGVSDEALALADQYLSSDRSAFRSAVVQQLVELRPRPVDVLVRLLTLEPNADLRSELMAAALGYRQAVPRLVLDGDLDGLVTLLEQAAADEPNVGCPDYAVEQFLTGRWDAAADRWRAELANAPAVQQPQAARVLCQLCRVAGRRAEATDLARRAGDHRLLLACAIDAGDWSAAADAATDCWPGPASATVRAGLLALAGRPTDAAAATAANGPDALPAGKLQLLLGHADHGLDLLSADPTSGGDPVAAFRLRQERGEYDQALALAARHARDPQVGPPLAAVRDDLRRLLGELPPAPQASPPPAAPKAGDDPWSRALSDLSDHRDAAAAADLAAGDADPDHIDWWFVRGLALAAAGDADRGHELMRAAALVPLGDPARRAWLADRLSDAGFTVAAAEQRALALAVADPAQDAVPVLDLHLAREAAAAAAGDYPAASAAADRVYLLSFWPGLTWKEPAAYLTVPADVHLARARLARAHDEWPTVLHELDAYRTFLPTSIELPLEWVPILDGRGDHAAADALFTVAFDHLDEQSAHHPRSPYLHNQAAWLAACCCRRLDAAVSHAEAAMRLAPNDWQYVDTLAECRFRTGDRTAAVDLERRAAALPDADGGYVARQQSRFAKGAVPSTTQPVAAPE